MNRTIITLPGIGNSGPEHWQSLWEAQDSCFKRFSPASWDQPELEDWIVALEAAVAASPAPAVLVAHSLACRLIPHWQGRSALPVAGAMLVAVPDAEGMGFPAAAATFANPPETRLRFPSVIVASGNDPYGAVDYSARRARQWGSRLVEVGELGHINAGSGIGAWPAGRAILDELLEEVQPVHA
jgi:predicted alpha/beta hydrolase family esterase